MDRVVPWAAQVELVTPYAPECRRGCSPFAVETMLPIHFMQQWFWLSDPAMEEALIELPQYREVAQPDNWDIRLPDETTILRFRHLMEKHMLVVQVLETVNDILRAKALTLRSGVEIDVTLIALPTSSRNASGKRDPEMHQSKKSQQRYFGIKVHVAVDAHTGHVSKVKGTAGNVADVVKVYSLLHGEEADAFGDAGYQVVGKRPDAK